MRGNRIPSALRLEILDRIHTGHQGMVKYRESFRQSIWWPELSTKLEETREDFRHLRKMCPAEERTCDSVQLSRIAMGMSWNRSVRDERTHLSIDR
jgi:hypothetical protein